TVFAGEIFFFRDFSSPSRQRLIQTRKFICATVFFSILVGEEEGTNQSATDTLSSPVPETDAVETAIPDNEKTECKVEVEPSVE
ncbi:hypothetical protein ACSLNR_27905, partial [Escherichia coli]